MHVIDYKKQEDARLEQENQEAQSEQEKGADAAKQESKQVPTHDPKGPGRPRTLYAWRAEITKGEELRYVSHLDYANLFLRAFDRAKLPMAYAGRFVAENEGGAGLCKVIVGAKYGEVLGVHMLGNPCSEIIYGACMAIEQEMTLKEMQEVVFPHPTVSEIFKETVFSFNE